MQSFDDDFVASARQVFGPGIAVGPADTGPVGVGTAVSGAEGAPSLESSTLTQLHVGLLVPGHTRQTGLWNVTVELYPDGSPRAVLHQSHDPVYGRRDGDAEPAVKGESERWGSAIARARSQLRRKLRCIRADHLYTFTKRGKFASLDAAWLAWAEFLRLLALRYPGRRWVYVAVPEQHADGTWHIHAGVPGFWDVVSVRVCWVRALGGRGHERGPASPGNVDVQYRGWGGRLGARGLSRYIAKYVGKGFSGVECGRRLFSSSKGALDALKVVRLHFAWDAGLEEMTGAVLAYLLELGCSLREWERRVVEGDGYVVFVIEEPD